MAVFETLLEITVYSAVIFAAIMLVKVCFKGKISPPLQYAIWGIFLLRLIIPINLESPVHFITIPAQTTVLTEEAIQDTQNETFNFKMPLSGVSKEQNAFTPTISETPEKSKGQVSYDLAGIKQAVPLTLPQILLIIWLCGTGACLGCYAVLVLLIKRKLKNRQTVPSKRLLALLEQVKTELGIRTGMKAAFNTGYGTPALLFPKTVSLPVSTLSAMDDEQVRNCLRHECMHYKRGDQIMNMLLLLLSAVYWFNPVVWFAFFQIRRDMEIACDSAVVRRMDTPARRDYATLILGMFSQAKRGQIALGMAQCGTRKAAEQRIRGIFMKNNSGRGMRFIAAALAIVLFVCCFTTACQPTPEKPPVIGKQDGLSDIIQSTPLPSVSASPTSTSSPVSDELYTKLGVPKHWSFEETALDGKLNIKADADIILPGVPQLPAATATLSEFTQEDLDKVANAFGVEDAEWTGINHTMPKEQIEKEILDYQARRAEYEAEGDDEMVKHMDENIEAYMQMYEDAPSEIEVKNIAFQIGEVKYGEELNGDPVTYMGFEGTTQVDDRPFYLCAGSIPYSDSVRSIRAMFGSPGARFGGVPLIDKPYGVSLTKEQAAEQASGIAQQLTDELKLCLVAPAASTGSRKWGWACVFMREINGCPTAYEQTDIGSDIETTVNEPVPYEKMVIVIDDEGMASFEWESPMTVESVDNPDVPLLPFEDISQRAKEQIAQLWAYEVANKKDNNGVDVSDPGSTAIITSVELGLMRVAKPDGSDYYYIPVWNFFSDFENTPGYYEKWGIKPLTKDDLVDENGNLSCGMTDGFSQWGGPAVTINALDGSVIDRNLGY